MAISSTLNPQAILGNRSNTITPESYLSSSEILQSADVIGAANNIVKFQTQSVRPVDNNAIVNNTIANISNNITSQVQQMNLSVEKSLKETVNNITKDYEERVRQVDSAKPTSLLERFTTLYKSVFQFINTFSDKKSLRNLQDNLKALQTSFTESFNVAKVIREVIIKIVKQLSNLPTASASGGGGFKIDVDIPTGGSPVKRTAPKGLANMLGGGRGKALALGAGALRLGALGAGALGLGALGAGTVNALSGSEELQPTSQAPYIPEDFTDKFTSIVDRFAKAVEILISGIEKKKSSSRSSGGGGGGAPSAGPSPSPSGMPSGPADFSGSANAEKAFNYFISQGYSKEQSAGIVGNLMQENVALDPTLPNKKGHRGIAQWDPEIRYPALVKFSRERGLNPQTLESQLQYFEHEMVTGSGGLSKERFLREAKTVEQSAVLMREGFFRPRESEAMDINRIKYGKQILSKYGGQPGTTRPGGKIPSVAAAPTQAQAFQSTAKTVAQPPPSQTPQIQTLTLPPQVMDVGGRRKVDGTPSAAPPPTGTSDIEMLPPGNPDNFLVLYSRLIYNIVDG